MGTEFKIKFLRRGADRNITRGFLETEVELILEAQNAMFSTWLSESEISRFNSQQSKEPFRVSAGFLSVLQSALTLADRSAGAYDPTVMPLVRLQGFGPGRERGQVDQAAIEAAREHVGHRKLMILGEYLEKRDPLLEIDLSSIAKGHAVDKLAKRLELIGVDSYLIDIGGELRGKGRKPDGSPWRVAVQEPGAADGAMTDQIVELDGRAIATSGDYRIYQESAGEKVHHILDPRTGVNAVNDVLSVSVLANTCRLADGLATALMVLGVEGAEGLLSAYLDEKPAALFLLRDGNGGVAMRKFGWE